MDCIGLGRRHIRALKALSADRLSYLTLGEFPRGVGHETLGELMRRGLAGMGISKRFEGKAGWRITSRGIHCMAKKSG